MHVSMIDIGGMDLTQTHSEKHLNLAPEHAVEKRYLPQCINLCSVLPCTFNSEEMFETLLAMVHL